MRFPFKENIMMIVYNSAMSETGPILGMKSGVDSRKAWSQQDYQASRKGAVTWEGVFSMFVILFFYLFGLWALERFVQIIEIYF